MESVLIATVFFVRERANPYIATALNHGKANVTNVAVAAGIFFRPHVDLIVGARADSHRAVHV
jgi:hypothetical protein